MGPPVASPQFTAAKESALVRASKASPSAARLVILGTSFSDSRVFSRPSRSSSAATSAGRSAPRIATMDATGYTLVPRNGSETYTLPPRIPWSPGEVPTPPGAGAPPSSYSCCVCATAPPSFPATPSTSTSDASSWYPGVPPKSQAA
jgi:hypothetical protein